MMQVYRASLFHLLGDPADTDPRESWFDDGALVVADGHVVRAGAWSDIAPSIGEAPVTRFDNALIVPGFVDCHVHYPQVDIIASPANHLIDWLGLHTFPSEVRFADRAVADEAAAFFLDQLLAHGTTTALVYATVHKGSAEALFEAAAARNMRIVSGKVLMDRHAPEGLMDTAQSGFDDSAALIRAWHGKGRSTYAVTPRFAVTSTGRQLELAGRLVRDNPDVLMHTHLAETHEEIAEVRRLFPDCADYLGVYEKFGLATERSVFAHCLHLSDSEWGRMKRHDCAVAFCPTSNLFLGSGLFDTTASAGARIGLGTDVGGGTSLSLLATMNAAFKVGQLRRQLMDSFKLFHLATLGAAKTLRLDSKIGNFERGKEADFLVLDRAATPMLARRLSRAAGPEEILFALALLGDDRTVKHSFVAGRLAHSRDGS
ncbi:MAG TPA: guanine deaminase [Rhizomicrobium sp.]|jgi:guanine deaminase|nr:guanine deaminase [Rhizomicrobium sp.]